jgi:Sulfotransferase domain
MLSRAPTNVVRDWSSDSRQWSGYKPRKGDVIIATAPKVGTTWMQQIVNLLIFQSPQRALFAPYAPISPLLHNVGKHAKLGGGEGGIRTLGTGYPVRQISNATRFANGVTSARLLKTVPSMGRWLSSSTAIPPSLTESHLVREI